MARVPAPSVAVVVCTRDRPEQLARTLAASCVVAAASYRWIELPALRRKERA